MGNANDRQVGGSHYKAPIQHWDYVIANDIPYLEAQIIRYVVRWRKKGGISDVEKAWHYLEKLLEVAVAEEVGKLRSAAERVAQDAAAGPSRDYVKQDGEGQRGIRGAIPTRPPHSDY